MQLTLPQSEIWVAQETARFRNVCAGRRFGKTYLSTVELLRAATSGKNKNCWYLAPTYGAAKEIAWDMLIANIPEAYIVSTNLTALTIKLINGSTISLKGTDNGGATLRGRSLDFCVLDEFSQMRPEVWYEVIRPSLSDREGSALFIGTPQGRNHFYDLWAKGLSGTDNWQSFQYTTIQGGNVSASEIEQARSDLDERTFKQEYEAEFVTYAGLIYWAFDRATSLVKAEDDGGVLHIGMDFNIDPMSAVIAQRRGSDLICIDEVVIYGSNSDEIAKEIHQRYPNRQIIVYPDPAARQRKTSAGGRTDLSILQNSGFMTKAKKAHPAIRDRINAVNSRLKTGDGKRHLFFTENCKQTIKSLERQTYKEGTSQPNKDDGYDHMNDALGYMVEYLFPVKTDYPVQQPTRWT